MRRIRYLALAALGAFVALPVARVYTAGAPWIQKIELRDNDLVGLRGMGVPGTHIDIYYKQGNFRYGVLPALCIYAGVPLGDCFDWCGWLNGGNALYLGSTQVSGAGTWQLGGRDLQVLPGVAAGRTCDTGVLTQIELHSQYGNVSVPALHGLFMARDGSQAAVWGWLSGADRVAAGVADGPNGVQNATSPWTIDTDEDGIDLCVTASCGGFVSWSGYTFDEILNFQPPMIEVRDDSPLVGPRDQEFGHVMGMLQGHKPGGSVLAVAYVPRPTPVGPTLNVNVDMNGSSVEGAGCDAAGGYFEFFP